MIKKTWFQSARQILSPVQRAVGLLLVFVAFSSPAFGRGHPEIDPGSAPSALALLVGGMLLLADRFRRQ